MGLKLVIIGGVAGGATAAARARRLNEDAEIILFERGEFISFANCGLPYYVSGIIEKKDQLLVTTKESFEARYNINIRHLSEVTSINRDEKYVEVNDSGQGEVYKETYDRIILTPGAEPIKPPIPGIDDAKVYTVRNIPDSETIKALIDSGKVKKAIVAGGGFIGIEMAENLAHKGVDVTIVEMADQVMAPLDSEIAETVHYYLKEKGIKLLLSEAITSFEQEGDSNFIITSKGSRIDFDMVILSVGVKPEKNLAIESGLETGITGAIAVNGHMQTSDPDIYAVGDAVEVKDFVTGMPVIIPLAGPANKQGRIAANNVFGGKDIYKGTQGTAIVKVFDMTIASTGANEKTLSRQNAEFLVSYTNSYSHATYYPGAASMIIKLLFTPENGKILGAQITGFGGVDKRIDVIATAIRAGMTVFDLEDLELAYAPPYSSAKDPVNIAGFVASNIIKGDSKAFVWEKGFKLKENEVLIDLRDKFEFRFTPMIEGSINIPLNDLRYKLDGLDKNKKYYLYCAIGLRGYLGYRVMSQYGFDAVNVSGGVSMINLMEAKGE
ncbi:MAG: FAD-dependent oxidoreductase [Desulfobacterales bacterium]|nr:FAD-dependent oxidoreductase [Desulfobacterales bacterium]MCP4161824.1 FAD-dependent oxidoreductase [Deltaproteobacteria bacterium]